MLPRWGTLLTYGKALVIRMLRLPGSGNIFLLFVLGSSDITYSEAKEITAQQCYESREALRYVGGWWVDLHA